MGYVNLAHNGKLDLLFHLAKLTLICGCMIAELTTKMSLCMLITVNQPQKCFDSLINNHRFKLRDPTYHIGGECFCNFDSTLARGAHSNVFKMLINSESIVVAKPKKIFTPLIEKDLQ
jgi:hypothetical protein